MWCMCGWVGGWVEEEEEGEEEEEEEIPSTLLPWV